MRLLPKHLPTYICATTPEFHITSAIKLISEEQYVIISKEKCEFI
jgi:hypothetical protein